MRWQKEGFVSKWRLGSFFFNFLEDFDLDASFYLEQNDLELFRFLETLEFLFSKGDFDLESGDFEY